MMIWKKKSKDVYVGLRSEWKFGSSGMNPLCYFKTFKECQHDKASSTWTFQPAFLFEHLPVR